MTVTAAIIDGIESLCLYGYGCFYGTRGKWLVAEGLERSIGMAFTMATDNVPVLVACTDGTELELEASIIMPNPVGDSVIRTVQSP